ncbi:hypothetical protein CBR_g37719 [Chara braunii]|uniref:Cilia- and flagella-associated protein 43 n=1 Tax=Chara braunii TaxID=69332 RepID=A0A388JZZ3_CHABU|nr:hypothetical protein CBR_g37719 [Chara braunii]|eukprot:GBG63362.1 hypothetical protein CBR_g37719 [Chara braunii]
MPCPIGSGHPGIRNGAVVPHEHALQSKIYAKGARNLCCSTRKSKNDFDETEGPLVRLAEGGLFASICGNSLHFQPLAGGLVKDRWFLWGEGYGIGTFAIHEKRRLVVYSEKGLNPLLFLHKLPSLEIVAKLEDVTELEVSVLEFSKNGSRLLAAGRLPDCSLVVWGLDLHTGRPAKLVKVQMEREVEFATFNPTNEDQICTSGDGNVTIWTMTKNFKLYANWGLPAAAPAKVMKMATTIARIDFNLVVPRLEIDPGEDLAPTCNIKQIIYA